jgi:hypothetical protein
MVWALHIANIMILCSFLVKDILVLRLLSIVAAMFFCLYFWHFEQYEPIIWNLVFSIVNVTQIGMLWFKRRKIPLLLEEQFLKDRVFPDLLPLEIRNLYQCATRKSLTVGEQLKQTSSLSLLMDGNLLLQDGNQLVHHLQPGQFIGIKGYISREETHQNADANTEVVYLQWMTEELRAWSEQSPKRHNLLLSALSKDLLLKMNQHKK